MTDLSNNRIATMADKFKTILENKSLSRRKAMFLMQESLADVQMQDLLEYLSVIQNDEEELTEVANQSFRHANGFWKIRLVNDPLFSIRLHHWTIDEANENNVHNHRFDFVSKILKGTVYQDIYIEDEEGDKYCKYEYFPEINSQLAKCVYVTSAKILQQSRYQLPAGAIYGMETAQLHNSISADNTVTLLCSVNVRQVETFVYTNRDDPSVAHKYFTLDDLSEYFNDFIKENSSVF